MNYPTIPKEEFIERQKRVQEMMLNNGIDLLITYSDDGATFGHEHARWLFDYQTHFEPSCILIPTVGEPVLMTGVESEDYIYASSYCTNVSVVDEFVYPNHEFPFADIVKLEDQIEKVINDSGREVKTVGFAGGENKMPYRLYKRFADYFGDAKLVNVDDLMLDLRAVKSKNEIKVMEHAFYIAEKGIEAAIEMIAEGKTEREIAAAAEHVMRNLGSEGMGIDTIVGSGKEHTYPVIARTTFREIQKNDLVLLTIAPRYEGYNAAIGRPVIVGEAEKGVEHAINTAIAAQNEARSLLKPGIEGYKVDQAMRKVAEDAGLGKHVIYSGVHSIGICEFEPPIMKSSYNDVLKEDMIFAIDIPLFFNSWGGLRYEDGFHVSKDGARPLQTLESKVIKV